MNVMPPNHDVTDISTVNAPCPADWPAQRLAEARVEAPSLEGRLAREEETAGLGIVARVGHWILCHGRGREREQGTQWRSPPEEHRAKTRHRHGPIT